MNGSHTTEAEHRYYSITQAAALLGVSRVSIWRWIRDGRLPVLRLGERTTRIRHDDLDRLLATPGPAGSQLWVGERHDAGAVAEKRGDGTTAPRTDWTATGPAEHFVQFYEADAFLLDAIGEFIGAGLHAGEVGIVIATAAHRADLAGRLTAAGLDVAQARASGRYVALDAAETLSRFMVDGMPDAARFAEVVGGVIAQSAATGRRVRAFGEMVALLAAEGNHAGVIRLEELWNDLQQSHTFALFCAYPMAGLSGSERAALLDDVCTTHSRVIPTERYTILPTENERLRAITALQQKAESLEAALEAERVAREAAEAALHIRDEFLSIAAHELRTPITTLSGRAQLALRLIERQGEPVPAQVAQALQVITNQSGKLSQLLNHLLDITRLDAGKLSLTRQPADLTALVTEVVNGARARTDRHSITLTAPTSLEASVDPLRLEQVLTNLLDNAIKYSPNGGPIEVVLAQGADRAVELSVRDHGLGIPVAKRGQIFERFYQAHGESHRSGLGLGLAICREIVALHGGEIRAEFPDDGGTRFVVRLPVAA